MYKQQVEEEKQRIAEIKVDETPTDTPRSTTSTSTDEEELPPSYTLDTPRSVDSDDSLPTYNELTVPGELNLPDVALDLINKVTPKEEEEEEVFDLSKLKRGNKKEKTPAFMSIFSNSNEQKPVTIESWKSGKGVIVDYGVKEDANSKGKKNRGRKGYSFGGASGGTSGGKDMEDTNLIVYPFPEEDSPSTMALFCVFDGHGGADCAIEAKKIFPIVMKEKVTSISLSSNSLQILRETFLNVDQQLEEFEYMGCTGTAVFVWEFNGKRYLQAANAGDSTAFIKRGDTTEWLTRGKLDIECY
jgi:hypothetical protein